jgi:hypothetical protein
MNSLLNVSTKDEHLRNETACKMMAYDRRDV